MPVFLKLFHGRDDHQQHMDDWGYDGPVLGPIDAVVLAYGGLRLDADGELVTLPYVDGLIHYAGRFYGDATLFDAAALPDAVPVDPRLTQMPEQVLCTRCETGPIPVPAQLLPRYAGLVAVFSDALLELGDPALADAALRSLHAVVRAEPAAAMLRACPTS